MRKFYSIVFFLLFFISSFGTPKLRVLNATEKLDTIYISDKVVSYELKYTNTGDSPLYLVNTMTFCPCVNIDFSEEALAPCDTASMKVSYTPEYEGEVAQGFRIFYNSDDPNESVTCFFYAYSKETPYVLEEKSKKE